MQSILNDKLYNGMSSSFSVHFLGKIKLSKPFVPILEVDRF